MNLTIEITQTILLLVLLYVNVSALRQTNSSTKSFLLDPLGRQKDIEQIPPNAQEDFLPQSKKSTAEHPTAKTVLSPVKAAIVKDQETIRTALPEYQTVERIMQRHQAAVSGNRDTK